MAVYVTNTSELTSIANAIRTKGGTSASLSFPTEFVEAINNISGGGGGSTLITKTITTNGTYSAEDDDADGYSEVTVNVHTGVDIPVFELQFDSNGDFVSATCNKTWAECENIYNNGDGSAYARGITEGDPNVDVIPLSLVRIHVVDTDDIIDYVGVVGAQPVFDVLYYSDGQIDFVIPSTYASELTATTNGTYTPQQNGVYTSVIVNVPSGSPNLQAKTNISPTTSSQTIQADSGYDGLSSVQINAMPSGIVTAPSTISGTSATVSTGTNTLTLTKTVSVTPTVSTAGYVSSGTAGNSSVSLTASVTTKAAATITPGTSNQTIAAGTYLTGAQTISGDADLVASNIISTANIFGVQGSVVIQHYYTGTGTPSSSTGVNGDIYLKTI